MTAITDQLLLTDDGQRLINNQGIPLSIAMGPKSFLEGFKSESPSSEEVVYGRPLDAENLNTKASKDAESVESTFASAMRMDPDAIFVPWSFFADAKVSDFFRETRADDEALSLAEAIKEARDTGHAVAVVYPGATPAELKRAGTVLEAVGLGSAEIHRFN